MTILVTILCVIGAVMLALAAYTAFNTARAERMVPPDGQFIDLPGARLHYLDIGPRTGPAIVMIHGLGGQMRNFTYALSGELVGEHRLIIVDRPGSGYSTYSGEGGRGLFGQAAIIAALIDRLGLEKPLVVGHSLGGAISLALAIRHGDRIGGLALLAPLTQPIEVDKINKVFSAMLIESSLARQVIAYLLAAPMGQLSRAKADHEIFGPEAAVPDFDVRGGGALSLRPKAFLAACGDVDWARREMAAIAAAYPTLVLPVGIMFAREDRLLPFDQHGVQTAAAIPGAALNAISGGHMFPLSQAHVAADWIRERLREGR